MCSLQNITILCSFFVHSFTFSQCYRPDKDHKIILIPCRQYESSIALPANMQQVREDKHSFIFEVYLEPE